MVNLKQYYKPKSELGTYEILVEYTDGTSETFKLLTDTEGE